MPTGFPEYYATACHICGEPLRLPATFYPARGKGPASVRLDYTAWHQHMKEKHPQ